MERNEAYHRAVTYEEISDVHVNSGEPNDPRVFTKPNEAYQGAATIESKENKAYGAFAEIFTKPNEAYHIPGSQGQLRSSWI